MNETRRTFGDARVWKYAVETPDARCRAWIYAHHTAELLSVAVQNDVMVVYALVWPDVEPDEHMEAEGLVRLIVSNTGAVVPEFPEGARFLGTVETNGIVWHVWHGDEETTA